MGYANFGLMLVKAPPKLLRMILYWAPLRLEAKTAKKLRMASLQRFRYRLVRIWVDTV